MKEVLILAFNYGHLKILLLVYSINNLIRANLLIFLFLILIQWAQYFFRTIFFQEFLFRLDCLFIHVLRSVFLLLVLFQAICFIIFFREVYQPLIFDSLE